MGEFKNFMESDESDARASLRKLPAAHRALVRGFRLKFVGKNTIPGDDQHIGMVKTKPTKSITVAAPWNYSRCFGFFHEIGHLVYEKYIRGTKLEQEWNKLCSQTKNKVKQNYEEIFCHSYANAYLDHKVEKHNHSRLINFILHRVPK